MAPISNMVVKRRRRLKRLSHKPTRSFMKTEEKQTKLRLPKDSRGLFNHVSNRQRKQLSTKIQQFPRPAVWPDQFVSLESAHAIKAAADKQTECSILCSKCSHISTWLQQKQPPIQFPYALRSLSKRKYNGHFRYGLPEPIKSFDHYASGIALEHSYLEGCHLCTLIWHCVITIETIGPAKVVKDSQDRILALLRTTIDLKVSLRRYRFSAHDTGLILSTTWRLPNDRNNSIHYNDIDQPFPHHIRFVRFPHV